MVNDGSPVNADAAVGRMGVALVKRGLSILSSFQSDISSFLDQLPDSSVLHGTISAVGGSEVAAHDAASYAPMSGTLISVRQPGPFSRDSVMRVTAAIATLSDDLDAMLRDLAAMSASAARRTVNASLSSIQEHSLSTPSFSINSSGLNGAPGSSTMINQGGDDVAAHVPIMPPLPAASWMLPLGSFSMGYHVAREEEDNAVVALEELCRLGVDVVSIASEI